MHIAFFLKENYPILSVADYTIDFEDFGAILEQYKCKYIGGEKFEDFFINDIMGSILNTIDLMENESLFYKKGKNNGVLLDKKDLNRVKKKINNQMIDFLGKISNGDNNMLYSQSFLGEEDFKNLIDCIKKINIKNSYENIQNIIGVEKNDKSGIKNKI